jgi:galactokinase
MTLAVRYPGRACLLGEHCDWAGGASLAIPLPLGVRIVVEPAEAGLRARSALEGRLLEDRWPVEGAIDRRGGPLRFVPAAAAALRSRGVTIPPAVLWIDADLPPGRGFSSSAAVTLAALDALARHGGAALEPGPLAELAFHVEHELLGVACGRLDPLACAAGAPVFLQWGPDGRAPLRRVPVGRPLHLVVGAFSAPRDTAGILDALHAHVFAELGGPLDPAAVTAVRTAVATWASEAEAGARALATGDTAALGAAMGRAQVAYAEAAAQVPALAAPRLAAAVGALTESGACGAKFSGAGGDGSVIAVFDDAAGAERGLLALEDLGDVTAWTVTLEDGW